MLSIKCLRSGGEPPLVRQLNLQVSTRLARRGADAKLMGCGSEGFGNSAVAPRRRLVPDRDAR